MIIKPRIKGFVCITSHPAGCMENVRQQAELASQLSFPEGKGPKKVLVIGSSTGYGLSSRISAAFSNNAATLGVSFEREPKEGKPGSAGHYNVSAFQKLAHSKGLVAEDINGDAFSNECKEEVIKKAKEMGGGFDLVIYSLASPRRTDPTDGQVYRACLKPIGMIYKNKTLDTDRAEVKEVTIDPANDSEIAHTEKVMGGEDWALWTRRLVDEDLLAEGCINLAYSYVGPEVTRPIYRNGTIGRAKAHLEEVGKELNLAMQNACGGNAYVSVNKAVVTQASSAIPVVPLYVSMLFKVMHELGTHEGCIEQTNRLFQDRLFGESSSLDLDSAGRIRLDDWEMADQVQQKIMELWPKVDTSNLMDITNFKEYQQEFLRLFGFGIDGVDYEQDVDPVNPF
ncbi:MAG TPA: bifunctional NADH-specific enoyl-ACP reductase/trans-2-enoyl-CoA reductase [Opitutae bacterium]|jgi:enoyl-[acyl-carrier protein] reductase/trans-2-enoyl-CoA reductase (NAD+)|nr:enoyl-[acyl-carrier-protein] reductase FabV [Opitutae bacterium]HAF58790.1 bifunctional NADH-specific enoyl-ACP reductase/trans-2-enoyl-CoA reductase [Opitutae bacterium]|tara:strand:+ start:983 stop:2173 length:1191 start_codon:yes stop_codon:yes gene_type:complete